MKHRLFYTLICFLPLLIFPESNHAQNFVTPPKKAPVSFHINYKYSFSDQGAFLLQSTDDLLQRFGFFGPVKEEEFDNLRSSLAIAFPEITHTISAGASYDIFSFLQGRLGLGYCFGKTPWFSSYGGLGPNTSPKREFQYSQDFKSFVINPELAIDLLFKNPNDALNILVGANFSNFQLDRSYKYETREPTSTRQFTLERSGWYFNWTVGMEWQEYIGKHFGYSLGFMFTPAFNFQPQQFEVSEFTINGESQQGEIGEKEYSDGFEGYQDGKVGTETISVKNFYQIKVGVQYRL